MSRWDWYTPAPKQPVPADGLQVDRFGTSWWGEQWMQALGRLGGGYSNRLPRGRTYARAGRVVNLVMGAGEVTAGVVGTRTRPYSVRISLRTFSRAQWQTVIDILARQARFTVALLRGELPAAVGEAVEHEGLDLFPASKNDLETECSCPDWANPCKHVAAVHYVVAAALDADPLLIFVLRGLGRNELMAALSEARGIVLAAKPPAPRHSVEEAMWIDPGDVDEDLFLGHGLPEPQLAFQVRPPEVELAGLSRLGPPPKALEDLPRRLARSIRKAGRAALALAHNGNGAAPSKATDDEQTVRERVLAFIRSRPEGVTMLMLRSRLPYDKQALRRAVRGMKKEGVIESSGRAAATRYALSRRAPTSSERSQGDESV